MTLANIVRNTKNVKITRSRVALCSDIHLGLHQSNNTWHNICLGFAEWLKQELIDKDIKDLIILGDVVDNRNEVSVTTLHILYRFFKILEDFNIIIITGNHDCYYSKRSDVHSLGTLNDWPNITVIDSKPITIQQFDKKLTFCPWGTNLADVSKCDILFGHFEINTFKMNGSHICSHGVDSQDVLSKAPIILTGHFHKTEDRVYNNNGRILYTGSPFEQNWGEANTPKGIYVLDIFDNIIEFVKNDKSPKHKKIRLSELLSAGKISDSIKKEFTNNIVNFVIDKEIDQKTIDAILPKLYTLKPTSITIENVVDNIDTISIDEEIVFEGIDIKSDILEYIDSVDDIKNRDLLIPYILDIYDKCNEVKK